MGSSIDLDCRGSCEAWVSKLSGSQLVLRLKAVGLSGQPAAPAKSNVHLKRTRPTA